MPTLFLEFHGSDASVKEQSERFGEIAGEFDGGPFKWTTQAEERTRLWQARHDAYFAMVAMKPGCRPLSTDVCVPISRLAEAITETMRDVEEYRLLGPIVGHVGDGNFHVGLMMDMDDQAEIERAHLFLDRLSERALRLDGTCTGEHGVGQGKIQYLDAEHGTGAMNLMRLLKRSVDPDNIMNPGKIFML